MEKIFSLVLLAILALCLVVMLTCGGGDKKAERSDDEADDDNDANDDDAVDDDDLMDDDDSAGDDDDAGGANDNGYGSCMRFNMECGGLDEATADQSCSYLAGLREDMNLCQKDAYEDYDACLDKIDCTGGWNPIVEADADNCQKKLDAVMEDCF